MPRETDERKFTEELTNYRPETGRTPDSVREELENVRHILTMRTEDYTARGEQITTDCAGVAEAMTRDDDPAVRDAGQALGEVIIDETQHGNRELSVNPPQSEDREPPGLRDYIALRKSETLDTLTQLDPIHSNTAPRFAGVSAAHAAAERFCGEILDDLDPELNHGEHRDAVRDGINTAVAETWLNGANGLVQYGVAKQPGPEEEHALGDEERRMAEFADAVSRLAVNRIPEQAAQHTGSQDAVLFRLAQLHPEAQTVEEAVQMLSNQADATQSTAAAGDGWTILTSGLASAASRNCRISTQDEEKSRDWTDELHHIHRAMMQVSMVELMNASKSGSTDNE